MDYGVLSSTSSALVCAHVDVLCLHTDLSVRLRALSALPVAAARAQLLARKVASKRRTC